MSLQDDRNAEVDAKLDWARQKSSYGKKFSLAFDLAERIKLIRALRAESGGATNAFERKLIAQTADVLLSAAVTATKKLRQVADALDAQRTIDPRQQHILEAYEAAVLDRYPPTFAAVRTSFIRRFGTQLWPPDFSVRKTLRILRLPLAQDVVGRPVGSKSSIHNR